MPVGLVVMKWDDLMGNVIEAKYPQEINISEKTLMQVYSTHEYSGEIGMISLMVGSLNIASYYTGPEKGYYFLLLLNLDDDPDAYEGGLSDMSRVIIQSIEDGTQDNVIPNIYRRISVYPTLNLEQQLCLTYQEEIKKKIINRLREEGVVTKSELMVWLKDAFKEGFVDIEGVLIDLIKRDIIKETSVKGMPSELIYLINDILMLRVPPIAIARNPAEKGLPEQLVNDYIMESKKFFQTYRPSEEDNLKLIDIITDPQVYETLRLLRTAIVTRNDIEKLKKKGVDDADEVLKQLWDANIIHVFQGDQNIEYFGLISDFLVQLIFPKYQYRVIKTSYEQKSKSDKVLIEYVKVLQDAYLNLKSEGKGNKSKKIIEKTKLRKSK